jgi:hypothetical protein
VPNAPVSASRPDGLIGYLARRTNTMPRYVDAWQSNRPSMRSSPISDWILTVLAQNRTIGVISATASQPLAKARNRRSARAGGGAAGNFRSLTVMTARFSGPATGTCWTAVTAQRR